MSKAKSDTQVQQAYELARARYAELGVDTEAALTALRRIPISLHCWQGDDVGGFESSAGLTGGGIMATGNHPGKARTPAELRQDLDQTYSFLPGKHRLALHAIYGEFGGKKVERSEVAPEHFANWIAWAKQGGIGLDFNPSFFSHPKAASGLTLAHADPAIRRYWIRHGQACRRVGAAMGKALGTPCVNNLWIPDGMKDNPVDRRAPRERLKSALDEVFAEKLDPRVHLDAVEGKLFGLGSECYVVGSHEFYLAYAVKNNVLLTLDTGHYHPTEVVSDKLSSVLAVLDQVLLHVSRGVRWDSDHVVIQTEELQAIAHEVVRHGYQDRVHIGLDFFDASINRVAAWTIGARAMLKSLLVALLEPTGKLRELEASGDFTGRLACLEELKNFPHSAVWDYYCRREGAPVGPAWLEAVRKYERDVQFKRQ